MHEYTKDDVHQAIREVINGKPRKSTSQKWGIPLSTLRDRLRDTQTHSLAAENQQKLSKVQEEHLANWVLTQKALGNGVTHG